MRPGPKPAARQSTADDCAPDSPNPAPTKRGVGTSKAELRRRTSTCTIYGSRFSTCPPDTLRKSCPLTKPRSFRPRAAYGRFCLHTTRLADGPVLVEAYARKGSARMSTSLGATGVVSCEELDSAIRGPGRRLGGLWSPARSRTRASCETMSSYRSPRETIFSCKTKRPPTGNPLRYGARWNTRDCLNKPSSGHDSPKENQGNEQASNWRT